MKWQYVWGLLVGWLSILGIGIDYWRYLGGFERPTTYLVLLQNDTEMRANGGFFGSYAVATIDKAKVELRFQDIYTPDGLGSRFCELRPDDSLVF